MYNETIKNTRRKENEKGKKVVCPSDGSVMLAGTLTGCAVDEKTQENGSEQAGDEGKSDEGGKITKSEKEAASR